MRLYPFSDNAITTEKLRKDRNLLVIAIAVDAIGYGVTCALGPSSLHSAPYYLTVTNTLNLIGLNWVLMGWLVIVAGILTLLGGRYSLIGRLVLAIVYVVVAIGSFVGLNKTGFTAGAGLWHIAILAIINLSLLYRTTSKVVSDRTKKDA